MTTRDALSFDLLRTTHCAECGYSLRELPERGRCPECGRGYTSEELVLFGWACGKLANLTNSSWTGIARYLGLLGMRHHTVRSLQHRRAVMDTG